MKRTFKMPAPQLSYLKEVNIDLDMSGRHYALLAKAKGKLPEDVALSILKDLMEEDANMLTLAELRYLFMMVKINNLENDYVVNIECQNINTKKKKICGCMNQVLVKLQDTDLNPTPSDYTPPKIKFRRDGTEKEYSVIPPTVKQISQLYDFFVTQKSADQIKIINDDVLSDEFNFLYGILHLRDNEGNCFVKDTDNFEDLLDIGLCEDGKTPKPTVRNLNKFSVIRELLKDVIEVGAYGVQETVVDANCKECGGRMIVPIPLLDGLLD
jgi:hypothetical protein